MRRLRRRRVGRRLCGRRHSGSSRDYPGPERTRRAVGTWSYRIRAPWTAIGFCRRHCAGGTTGSRTSRQGDHGRAHAPGVDAGERAAARRLRRAPGPLGGRAALAAAGPVGQEVRSHGSRKSRQQDRHAVGRGGSGGGRSGNAGGRAWTGGGASDTGSEAVAADPGPWCGWGGPIDYPADQRADDGLSLTFDTAPLAEALEIFGFPSARLVVTSDRPRALVAVRLCDLWPDGASTLVTRGLLNLTHRVSSEEPSPLEPGRRYSVDVRLGAIAYAVPPGHRLRLAISPTYWPWAWPSPEPVTLTVVTGRGSFLDLPLRTPPRAEEPAPPHFSEPEAALRPPYVALGAGGEER